MTQEKNGFLLYKDLVHTLRKLDDERAGKLFKHILEYVNGCDPHADDFTVELVFEPIKHQLKRDLKSYEKKVVKKSESGTAGNLKKWHPDLYEMYRNGEITLEQSQNIANDRKTSHPIAPDRTRSQNSQTVANVAVTVTDSDTVTVNETVTDNDNETVVVRKSYNIGLDHTNDIKNFYQEKLSISFNDLCLKHGNSEISAALDDFGEFHNNAKWKDINDFRRHFMSYLLKWFDKKEKKVSPKKRKGYDRNKFLKT